MFNKKEWKAILIAIAVLIIALLIFFYADFIKERNTKLEKNPELRLRKEITSQGLNIELLYGPPSIDPCWEQYQRDLAYCESAHPIYEVPMQQDLAKSCCIAAANILYQTCDGEMQLNETTEWPHWLYCENL